MTITPIAMHTGDIPMLRIAGLASNRGRNLLHLAEREPAGATLGVVLSNKADAPILERAAARGIPTEVVEQGEDSREDHEERVLSALGAYEFDLVCLDGYMRVLTASCLDRLPTVLNVHPSLLPAFPGMDAWGDALDAGVRLTGATVHVVTEEVDGGPIVTQEPVPVFEGDDRETLKQRVLYHGEFQAYPRAVRWFATDRVAVDWESETVSVTGDVDDEFPDRFVTTADQTADLRYGENPHQAAALYSDATVEEASVVNAPQLNPEGKALSYNNFNDADAALDLIKEFDEPAAAVIKHTNPAGCATADSLATAYEDALATDPMSAFGGIVALNRPCDAPTATAIIESYKEVVVAPEFTDPAMDVFRDSSDLRLLAVGSLGDGGIRTAFEGGDPTEPITETPLTGGRLLQERDSFTLTPESLDIVTDREPTEEQLETMCFAWSTLKHVKSNAILFATGTETVGIGMGQVSRIDAVRLAAMKADEHAEGKSASGAVMASDAYFPFPDSIEEAASAGIEAVVQPGGSVNDDDVIEAADEHDMAMAFTGHRCFRHD